jgi:hypothetical protein
LLFLGRYSRLEHFFAGTDIPFDCEMLVAQQVEREVFVLSEVYRTGPSLPLQSYRLGNWTPGEGIAWPTQYIYSRRNKLHGLVLKTGVIEVRALQVDNYRLKA